MLADFCGVSFASSLVEPAVHVPRTERRHPPQCCASVTPGRRLLNGTSDRLFNFILSQKTFFRFEASSLKAPRPFRFEAS